LFAAQDYYDGLIANRMRAFDWYKNQQLWMTLNGGNALMQKKNVLRSPTEKFD